MPTFAEIGLRTDLLQTLEEEEISSLSVQEAVIPALRRGAPACGQVQAPVRRSPIPWSS